MDKKTNPVIGKDVIESLTLGMYEDSRFIFREYVQNSADQIDKAIAEKLMSANEGEIHITIEPSIKKIVIEDNATGISEDQVSPILRNIAQSTKIRGEHKGFRGIGRLGGLAYCKKLTFETSFKGEKIKSILSWDAEKLRQIINNRTAKEDAVSVINEVTSLKTEKEDSSAHYFRVTMEGVTNEMLLDTKEIHKYLSMVAPVPFPTGFIFRNRIYSELKKQKITLDEYKIYLNTEQLFKGYSTYIYDGEEQSKRKVDELIDLVFFKEHDKQKKLLYWGWYAVSTLNRQIPSINYCRGLRLRKSNIQVGDEYTLIKLHRDRRFNFYFFGEIHGLNKELIPNSRRDYFTENDICLEFEKHLRSYLHGDIYQLCYRASEINSSLKKIDDLKKAEEEYKRKSKSGFTDKKEAQELKEKFEKKKQEAIKATQKIGRIGDNATESVSKILNKVVKPGVMESVDTLTLPKTNGKPKLRADNFSKLSSTQKDLLGRVFSVIRDVLDEKTAENLIQKIEEDI